jgi:hypothetical protein
MADFVGGSPDEKARGCERPGVPRLTRAAVPRAAMFTRPGRPKSLLANKLGL